MKRAYVVSILPESKKDPASKGKKLYYCHHEGFPQIPIFGSVGTRAHAQTVCDQYNGIPASERRRRAKA